MPREDSPFVYGEYWLDKRRDGKAADVWQIAWYEPGTRQVRYRSTKRKGLDDAKAVIRAHEEEIRAKGPQKPEDAKVLPLLFNYWDEHGGRRFRRSDRQLDPPVHRLSDAGRGDPRRDRGAAQPAAVRALPQMAHVPHSYDVPWAGKDYRHSSKGVSGESVQRNLDDIRAALNHNTGDNARLPWVPKVPASPTSSIPAARPCVHARADGRDHRLFGLLRHRALRFILLMMGTLCRPEARFGDGPRQQYRRDVGVIDLHPPAWPRTKKHNAELPVIPELRPWLDAWARTRTSRSCPARSGGERYARTWGFRQEPSQRRSGTRSPRGCGRCAFRSTRSRRR
jgi:hypothetical protein